MHPLLFSSNKLALGRIIRRSMLPDRFSRECFYISLTLFSFAPYFSFLKPSLLSSLIVVYIFLVYIVYGFYVIFVLFYSKLLQYIIFVLFYSKLIYIYCYLSPIFCHFPFLTGLPSLLVPSGL